LTDGGIDVIITYKQVRGGSNMDKYKIENKRLRRELALLTRDIGLLKAQSAEIRELLEQGKSDGRVMVRITKASELKGIVDSLDYLQIQTLHKSAVEVGNLDIQTYLEVVAEIG
jgi:hypothetical protein